MTDSLTINEVRAIVAEFNKNYDFNLIETGTPSRVKTVYSFPTEVDINYSRRSEYYGVNIYWSSLYFNKHVRFSGNGKRANKRQNDVRTEIYDYRKDIFNKIDKITNLYLEL